MGDRNQVSEYIARLNRRRDCEGPAFEFHQIFLEKTVEPEHNGTCWDVKLTDALRDLGRSVYPIDDCHPMVLRDLHYPDRLFELTPKVFAILNLSTENGLISGAGHLPILIK